MDFLDIKTVFALFTFISLVVVLFAVYIYMTEPGRPGAARWVTAVVTMFVSALLFSLGSKLPAVFSVYLANSLLLLVPYLIYSSLCNVAGSNINRIFQAASAVSIALFAAAAGSFDTGERIVLVSMMYFFLWGVAAIASLRKRLIFAGVNFAAVSLASLGRFVYMLTAGHYEGRLVDSGPVTSLYIMVLTGFMVSITVIHSLALMRSATLELHHEQQKLKASVDQSSNAVLMTDPGGRIVYANRALEELSGYSRSEMTGQTPGLFKSDRHPEKHFRDMWEVIKSGRSWSGQICNQSKDKKEFWSHLVITPVKDKNGQTTHFMAVYHDISKEKNLDEFRLTVDAIMRHNLKSPLNLVINYPVFLLQGKNLTDDQRDQIVKIKQAGENILNQINRSLDLFEMEQGNFKVKREKIGLIGISEQVISELHAEIMKKKLEIVTDWDIHNRQTVIYSDHVLVYRMVSNLIKNAVDASEEYERVTIMTRMQNGLVFSVHNSGFIPPEIQDKFFEKFVTTGKQKGTGLGSYTARLIADYLDIALDFTTGPEEGTTLYCRFNESFFKEEQTELTTGSGIRSINQPA